MDHARLGDEEFRKIYSRVPRATVEVIIKSPLGVVLTKRTIEPYRGYWHIPGGTIYFGEGLAEAVKRVALRETGLKVGVGKLLSVIEYPSELAYGVYTIGIAFLVHPKGKIKLNGSPEGEEVEFFRRPPEPMIPEQRDFLVKFSFL